MLNPYTILGVTRSMGDDEIKKAYRALAIKYHPDHYESDDATLKMAEINEAYNKIKTKELRDKYDKEMSFCSDFGLWSTLFGKSNIAKDFGKNPVDKKLQKNGKNITKTVVVPEEQLNNPSKITLKYKRNTSCYYCSGTGSTKYRSCTKCGGTGKVRTIIRDDNTLKDKILTCSVCNGSRLESIETCNHCNGKGVEEKEITIAFNHNGKDREYTVIGKGHSGINNGTNGNLIIKLRGKKK